MCPFERAVFYYNYNGVIKLLEKMLGAGGSEKIFECHAPRSLPWPWYVNYIISGSRGSYD